MSFPLILAGSSGGYQPQKSLRFRGAATPYLWKSYPSATQDSNNLRKAYSMWVKRGSLGSVQELVSNYAAATDFWGLYFSSDDRLCFYAISAGSIVCQKFSNRLFRDPTGHMHVVLLTDTANPVAEDRVQLIVNNERITVWNTNTNPALNNIYSAAFLAPAAGTWYFSVGRLANATNYLDGNLSDLVVVDGGSNLSASAFGVYNQQGYWTPKRYGSSYFGVNGVKCTFTDTTSVATLGNDSSGQGNHLTPVNFSLAGGVNYDSMLDVPLGGGVGDRGNYATLNPVFMQGGAIKDGNLRLGPGNVRAGSTLGISSGKWVWWAQTNHPTFVMSSGLIKPGAANAEVLGFGDALSWGWYANSGQKWFNSSNTAWGSAFTSTSDVARFEFDADLGQLSVFKNGVLQGGGPMFTGLTDGPYFPAIQNNDGTYLAYINFGQRPPPDTPTAGFKTLHTGNFPEPSVPQVQTHHNTYLVSKVGDTGFTLAWDASVYDTLFIIKRVDATGSWYLVDGLRGYDKVLYCPSTSAENTDVNVIGVSGTTCTLKSTLADGVYVIEAHKAGLSAARSTNTSGTLTSTVSANLVSGFSMVAYTGTAVNATVGHGQNTPPQYGIVRNRGSSVDNWNVYHSALTSPAYRLRLNTTDPEDSVASMWNSTAPTSSVFSVGTQTGSNGSSSPMLAYWWSPRKGYSTFTSYLGTGSADGPYLDFGFRPRGLDTKGVTVAGDWLRLDSKRNPDNPVSARLLRNTSDAEAAGTHLQDFTAGGDKIRNSNTAGNSSGSRYLVSAFAEVPTKYALAR